MRHALMNLCRACFVLAMLCVGCHAQESWLLKDANGSWKRFNTEVNWRKVAQETQPLETAVVDQTLTKSIVTYDVQGESGDWRNIDRYTFRPDGALIELRRTFASVSQDLKLTQIFEADAAGKVIKARESEVSLSSDKPMNEVSNKPPLPIASNIQQLGFMQALK